MQKRTVCLKFYIRTVFLLFCCVSSVNAIDSSIFNVANITADNWSLKNAVISINSLNQASPQLSLKSATLILPPPFDTITALNIRCKHFLWSENYINCSHGQVRFNSAYLTIPEVDFSFQFKDANSDIEINEVPLFGGSISVSAQELAGKWSALIKAKRINLEELGALIALDELTIKQGHADFEIQVKGEQNNIQALAISALLKNLSIQDSQKRRASEGATINSEFSALKQGITWQWQHNLTLNIGGVYIEPVYLDINNQNSVTLTANGAWLPEHKRLQINQFNLKHPQVLKVQGNAILSHKTGFSIDLAELMVEIPELKSATPIYLLPFLESGGFDGIEIAGQVNVKLAVSHDELTNVSIVIKNLLLDDLEQRLQIKQANAQIHWSKQQEGSSPSFISWQGLKLYAIPFKPGQLDFSSINNKIELLNQANLEALGGTLSINSFSFSSMENDMGALIAFEGSINKLSLAQLSKALGWRPLSGTISGYIPSVSYQERTLSLMGELNMQVFDGDITISNLSSSGMFTDFSQIYADIEYERLDLAVITHKFHTGYIEGRLSGAVQKLYLENWQPVSFYAWAGTPDNDDSTHRISQKAVENIASIGGGNISDVLSRGFLGLFSTFGYSKLGLGCYLYQGVCQLMGVEAVDNGFYLIKGGGLPRIDVIGYNPRLNWNELLIRLNRITASDQVVIE